MQEHLTFGAPHAHLAPYLIAYKLTMDTNPLLTSLAVPRHAATSPAPLTALALLCWLPWCLLPRCIRLGIYPFQCTRHSGTPSTSRQSISLSTLYRASSSSGGAAAAAGSWFWRPSITLGRVWVGRRHHRSHIRCWRDRGGPGALPREAGAGLLTMCDHCQNSNKIWYLLTMFSKIMASGSRAGAAVTGDL